MRPRRLLDVLCVLSLLLCAAFVVLWVRSYFVSDFWSWATPTGRAGVDSLRGSVSLGRVDVPRAALANISRGTMIGSTSAEAGAAGMLKPSWSFAGLGVTDVNAGGMRARDVRLPYWLLALAAAALPAARAARRKLRGSRAGLCQRCGYDLRASPERCPECGTPAAR